MDDFLKGFFLFLFGEHKYKQKISFFMQILKLVASIYSSQIIYANRYGNNPINWDLSNIITSLYSYQFIVWLMIFGFYFFIFYDGIVLLSETIYTQFFSPIRKYPLMKKFFTSLEGKEVVQLSLLKAKTRIIHDVLKEDEKALLARDFSVDLYINEKYIVKCVTYLTLIISQLPVDWTMKIPFWGFFIVLFLVLPKIIQLFDSVFQTFTENLDNEIATD